MIQSAKFRAKRDGVPCTIKPEDIVIPKTCPALGIPLKQGNRRNHANAPTLDRIIPELGYVPGNVRVISHRANLIKNNATLEELNKLVSYLYDNKFAWVTERNLLTLKTDFPFTEIVKHVQSRQSS